MRRQSFFVLAGVTAAAVIGAAVAVGLRGTDVEATGDGERMFPALFERANNVDRLVVRSAEGGTITLDNADGRWVVAEKGAYPANFERVRGTILSVAQMRTEEARTSRPELLGRLDLQDVDAEESKSVQVTAREGESVLADVLIGRWQATGSDQGLFVRRAGETQSWLVKGGTDRPEKRVVQWLDRDIVNVDQRRVKSVTISHAGGDVVRVERAEPGSETLVLASKVPPGREAKAPHELDALASITDFLILDDVRPAKDLDFAKPAVRMETVTFDGATLVFEGVEHEDRFWVRVAAATAGAPDPALEAFVAANKGKDSAAGRTADQFRTAEQVAEQMRAVAAKTDGWAYRLTEYKTGKMRTDTQAVTQAPAPAGDAKPAN